MFSHLSNNFLSKTEPRSHSCAVPNKALDYRLLRLSIIHSKYSSHETCDTAESFWVKIVTKTSDTKKKYLIISSGFEWKRCTTSCRMKVQIFHLPLFKTYKIFVIYYLLRFYRSYMQNNKMCIFISLFHNWNIFLCYDYRFISLKRWPCITKHKSIE